MLIGLTGGVATGKTLVANIFQELGARIIDADVVARSVVKPGLDAYNDIVKEFGEAILNNDKTINRKALGKIVFNDKEKLKKLNSFTHPRIRIRIQEEIAQVSEAQPERIIVKVVPLLIEEGTYKTVDKVILVTASKEKQVERYVDRDKGTREDAINIIESQMSDKEKRKYADFVLENDSTLEDINKKAKELYNSLASIKN